MKINLKNYSLAIITIISGLLISGFYYFLSPQIAKTKQEKQVKIMQEFFPEGKEFLPVSDALTLVKDANQKDLGFVCKTEDGGGYGGTVKFIVALDKDWKIKDFIMTEHSETPGLGTLVNEPWFRKGFQGIIPTLDKLPSEKKEFREKLGIDALSGATYSSMATVKAMGAIFKKAGDYYQKWQFERVWNTVTEAYSSYAVKIPAQTYRRRAVQPQSDSQGTSDSTGGVQ